MKDQLAFERFTLPSGARVFHQYRDLPWFTATVSVNVGHVDDPKGKEGLAHLLEHQMNSGTRGMPWKDYPGFREWTDENEFAFSHGTTDLYETWYGGRAWVKDAMPFFSFLAAFLLRPALDGALDHDRRIIRAERVNRARDSRASVLSREYNRAVFGEHRLATVTGLPEDDILFGLTQEDVRARHERSYVPSNMTFIVAGGIDARRLMHALDASLPERMAAWSPTRTPLGPIPDPSREFVSRKAEGRARSVQVDYDWYANPTDAVTAVLARNCLDDAMHERVRERLRLAYSVRVGTRVTPDCLRLTVGTDVAPEHEQAARDAIVEVLAGKEDVLRRLSAKRRGIALAIAREDMTVGQAVSMTREHVALAGGPRTLEERVAEFKGTDDRQVAAFLDRLAPERAYVTVYEM